MARPPPDPDMVSHALAQVRAGHTYAQVAAELTATGYKYSESAIAKWVQAAGITPAPVSRAPAGLAAHLKAKREQKPAEPAPMVDVTDTLGTLRSLVEGMLKEAHDCKISNPKLSASLAKNAGELMNTILRGEKTKAEDETLLRISRSEIAETWAGLLERVKVLTSERPLLCAECSRELSIEWGDAHAKIEEAKKLGGQ